MTYEEAKMQIQAIPEKIWDQLSEPDREAMEMAFYALQEQDVPDTNVGDTISRQAAIDAVDKHLRMTDVPVSYPGIVSALTEWLNELPSAQPERKKGKWINIRHDNIAECDQCGITGRAWMNFCFDCGSDNREGGAE